MSISSFCISQRQKEQQQLKKLLATGFIGSILVHSGLVLALTNIKPEPLEQVEKPIDLVIVEAPQPQPPKTKIVPKPEPEPEPEPKPEPVKTVTAPPTVKQQESVKPKPTPTKTKIVPKPIPKPEPVKTINPTPTQQQEPVKPKPIPPKLATKRVLTSPTPAPSQPVISGAISDDNPTSSLNSNFKVGNSTEDGSSDRGSSSEIPGAVATNSGGLPPSQPAIKEGIACISNCEPGYPSALEGAEGSAEIKLTIDLDGNVIGAQLTSPNNNSQLNREALLAARQMQFSSPGKNASVRVKIEFTVAGSEYDLAAREAQEQRERDEKERKEQEAARQQQLERERQARQEQLQQQQESTPATENTQTESKPLPALSPEELDVERLRKFQERIENYHN